MSMSEIDRQFFALTNPLIFETNGIHEYRDVTAELKRLQDDFVDHLVAIDGFNADDIDTETFVRFLHTQLTTSLELIEGVTIGDKIITTGQGIIIRVDEEGMRTVEYLADDVRLHGTLHCPYVIEIPLSIDIMNDDTFLDLPDDLAVRPGVVLEIHDAAIETVDPDAPYTSPEPIDNSVQVFLPIDYPDLRIKRQLPPQS